MRIEPDIASPRTLIDAWLPSDEEFVEAAGWWLAEASRLLAGPVWGQMVASAPMVRLGSDGFPRGVPGDVAATLSVLPQPPWTGGEDSVMIRPYSPANIEWMLGELVQRPLSTEFELVGLDADGEPHETTSETLLVRVMVLEDTQEWVQFTAGIVSPLPGGDLRQPAASSRWAEVCQTMAQRVDVSFGHVCDDDSGRGQTPLDEMLFRGGRILSITKGREVLRGYSWVTVVPAGLAQKLGGAQAMRASGAFAVVDELPFGGLWLQATRYFAEYDPAAVHRVFRALAPVLPAGQAKPKPFDERPRRLIWDDAANWR